ncbi:hypothetical protein ACFFX0_23800 [Citricoccus parietis]|uniref:Uncharacterized protein n=1 Tax=Citricoccus parietis TaxID=592307 RepID=A0ABV5FST8_9MICC
MGGAHERHHTPDEPCQGEGQGDGLPRQRQHRRQVGEQQHPGHPEQRIPEGAVLLQFRVSAGGIGLAHRPTLLGFRPAPAPPARRWPDRRSRPGPPRTGG